MNWAGCDLRSQRPFWFWDETEDAMKSIRYKGPMSEVTLITGQTLVRGGDPVPVPDDVAAEFLSTRPDEFESDKPAKAARGAAAGGE